MSSKSIKAFAPGNISCFFKVYNHKNPRWAGSYGMGFTVDEGVTVAVSKSPKNEIKFNNKKIVFSTVADVVKKLTKQKIRVEISSKLPLGCGFGLSGASALATAYGVNKLLRLGFAKEKLAIIAHMSEVENKTGLGDVVNQFYGGFFLKTKPSSYFIVKKIPLINISVYCKYFSALSTKAVLTNKSLIDKIEKAGSTAMDIAKKLLTDDKKIRLGDLIQIGKQFVVETDLLKHKKTMDIIKKIEKNGGKASMIILGNAIYSDIPFKGAIKLKISDKGAHLV